MLDPLGPSSPHSSWGGEHHGLCILLQKVDLCWNSSLAGQTLVQVLYNSVYQQYLTSTVSSLFPFASEHKTTICLLSQKKPACFYRCNKTQFHCLRGVMPLIFNQDWEDLETSAPAFPVVVSFFQTVATCFIKGCSPSTLPECCV